MSEFKKFICGFIILFFSFAGSGATSIEQAKPKYELSLHKVAKNYGHYKTRSRAKAAGAKAAGMAKAGLSSAGKVFAHQGQTIIFIMALTALDLVKQHVEDAYLTTGTNDIDGELLLEHITKASHMVVNSGEVWGGIYGAGATSLAGLAPMMLINNIINKSSTKPLFKQLMIRGMGTMVGFLGWELGGTLFSEAVELIEDQDDYEMALNFGSLMVSFVNFRDSPEDSENKRVARLIFSNMKKIVFEEEKLRDLWLYNTWRHHIATGEFVTIVSAMVAAGTLSAMYFPTLPSIAVGLLSGTIGGVAYVLAPKSHLERLTYGFQVARENIWRSGFDTNGFGHKVRRQVMSILSNVIKNKEQMPSLLSYPSKPKAKNKMMTVYFEQLFSIDAKISLEKLKRRKARNYENRDGASEFHHNIKVLKTEYLAVLDKMLSLYREECIYLETSIKETGLVQLLYDEKKMDDFPLLNDIQHDYNRSKTVLKFLEYFKELALESERSELYDDLMYRFDYFGFDQDFLLQVFTE